MPLITADNVHDVLSSGKLPVSVQQRRLTGSADLGLDNRRAVTQAVANHGFAAKTKEVGHGRNQ